MTTNPALIEADRFEYRIAKKRRLETAALTLLLLKCCDDDAAVTASAAKSNDGRVKLRAPSDVPVDQNMTNVMTNIMSSNRSHDEERMDDLLNNRSFIQRKDSKKRTFSSRREWHQLTKMAFSYPSLVLKTSTKTTHAGTKKIPSFGGWNCHLPQGCPMPAAPRLPCQILRAPARTKGDMKRCQSS